VVINISQKHTASFFTAKVIYSENERKRFLPNTHAYLSNYMVSHPRRE
jgi:hypothetical protein